MSGTISRVQRIVDYMGSAWTLGTPSVSQIKFSTDWFDHDYASYPQIVVREQSSLNQEWWNTGGSYRVRMNTRFIVSAGHFIPAGSPGTQEFLYLENMRRHISDIFRYGLGMGTNKYGGSITPIRVARPIGIGRALQETDGVSRFVRYEIELDATEDMVFSDSVT